MALLKLRDKDIAGPEQVLRTAVEQAPSVDQTMKLAEVLAKNSKDVQAPLGGVGPTQIHPPGACRRREHAQASDSDCPDRVEYREALRRQPNDPAAANNLVWFIAENGGKPR